MSDGRTIATANSPIRAGVSVAIMVVDTFDETKKAVHVITINPSETTANAYPPQAARSAELVCRSS
jgi:hypothetical protein